MQKLYAEHLTSRAHEAADREVYLASEADARFAELERALKSCATTLILDIREREKFLHAAKEAVLEANKALDSNTTG